MPNYSVYLGLVNKTRLTYIYTIGRILTLLLISFDSLLLYWYDLGKEKKEGIEEEHVSLLMYLLSYVHKATLMEVYSDHAKVLFKWSYII